MGSQCPICFNPLETRSVAPCFVCGGWPEYIAKYDPARPLTHYRLPMGDKLVLCESCKLEEFMVPSGWGYKMFPNELQPWDVLTPITMSFNRTISKDKFCLDCNIRLALAKLIVAYKNWDELTRDLISQPDGLH